MKVTESKAARQVKQVALDAGYEYAETKKPPTAGTVEGVRQKFKDAVIKMTGDEKYAESLSKSWWDINYAGGFWWYYASLHRDILLTSDSYDDVPQAVQVKLKAALSAQR